MPIAAHTVDNNEFLLRVLAYGPAKCKKTWWAATAAEAGFNVLLINGDDGTQVLKNISKPAQSRIRIIDCFDAFGAPRMAEFMARFLRGNAVTWDDLDNKMAVAGMLHPEHPHFVLDPKALTKTDVLIVDSWTALSDSTLLKMASEQNVDLSDGAKVEWDLYGPVGRFLTWVLQQLIGLNCHVILIGHQDSYEKNKKTAAGKLTAEVEFTRMQVKSSSRPHAMQLPKFFSDVLYFNMIGVNYYIDTSAHASRDGGCRGVAPKNWPWNELSFARLCQEAHAVCAEDVPDIMQAALYYPAGETPTNQSAPSLNKPLGGTSPITVAAPVAKPAGGLAALLSKKG